MTRKTVKVSDSIIGRYETYTLDELTSRLKSCTEQVPEELRHTVRFEIDMYSEQYCSEEYPMMFMYYDRPETDIEYRARQSEEAYYLEQVKKNDLATYERLCKQFEAK